MHRVNIPRDFTRELGWEKGNEIEIYREGNTLVLRLKQKGDE